MLMLPSFAHLVRTNQVHTDTQMVLAIGQKYPSIVTTRTNLLSELTDNTVSPSTSLWVTWCSIHIWLSL